jgi:hypothetical protein
MAHQAEDEAQRVERERDDGERHARREAAGDERGSAPARDDEHDGGYGDGRL